MAAGDTTTFDRRNPLDGSISTRAAAATVRDAHARPAAARTAFGPGLSWDLRLDAAQCLEFRLDAFAYAMNREVCATCA